MAIRRCAVNRGSLGAVDLTRAGSTGSTNRYGSSGCEFYTGENNVVGNFQPPNGMGCDVIGRERCGRDARRDAGVEAPGLKC